MCRNLDSFVWTTPLLCKLPFTSFSSNLSSLFFNKSIQTTENCSAEVLFSRGEQQRSAQVQASCEALLKIDTKAQEEEFYQQYKMNQSLQSAQHLPGM